MGLQIQRDSPCEKVRCDWLDEWAKDLTACLLQTWQCNDGIGDTPWKHSDGFGFPGHPRKRTAGDGLVTSRTSDVLPGCCPRHRLVTDHPFPANIPNPLEAVRPNGWRWDPLGLIDTQCRVIDPCHIQRNRQIRRSERMGGWVFCFVPVSRSV